MARWIFCALFLILCGNLTGCASGREDTELDQLWRDGYGARNPNLDRMKRGQTPLNFDGSEYRR